MAVTAFDPTTVTDAFDPSTLVATFVSLAPYILGVIGILIAVGIARWAVKKVRHTTSHGV